MPYKGGIGTPYNDLVGGRLDMQVITFSNAQPLLKTDKLRALAVTSKERHPGFPDVPTVAERLVPDYDVVSWLGFTSPAGLPPALRDRLYEAFRQAMARPEIKSKLEELGNDTRSRAHRLNFAPGSRPTWRAGGRSPMSSTSRKVKALRGVSAS